MTSFYRVKLLKQVFLNDKFVIFLLFLFQNMREIRTCVIKMINSEYAISIIKPQICYLT